VDHDRIDFDRQVHRMAGVLDVREDHPGPGDVTLRVVAGHGDRIRHAADAIAPVGLAVHVLEDDLVTTVPVLPRDGTPPAQVAAEERRRAAELRASGGSAELRCSYVFCRHRVLAGAYGLRAGDRCRQKIGAADGWMPCPGHYEPAPAGRRRRWWSRRR
jgi:hypothetical protein